MKTAAYNFYHKKPSKNNNFYCKGNYRAFTPFLLLILRQATLWENLLGWKEKLLGLRNQCCLFPCGIFCFYIPVGKDFPVVGL
jgi:hypothetical protein